MRWNEEFAGLSVKCSQPISLRRIPSIPLRRGEKPVPALVELGRLNRALVACGQQFSADRLVGLRKGAPVGGRAVLGLLIVVVALISCTTYGMQRNTVPASGSVIDRDGGFYVTLAGDGEYNGKPYAGSGRAVTEAVAAALSKHSLRVETASSTASFDENLRTAREKGLRFVATPSILHWEDRATEWSGIPDKISIRLAFVDAESGRAADSAVVSGRSKWATFGGDHPQDLLPGALDPYVEQLFSKQICPTSGCI